LSGLSFIPTNSAQSLQHTTFTRPSFDESKAYASQEDVFFDDGRETELLRFIYDKPNIDEIRGSPEKVLAAVDEFGRTQKYLMNVGEDKGKIVSNLIAEVKPETMVSSP
jgi:catechol O-methyltransferase